MKRVILALLFFSQSGFAAMSYSEAKNMLQKAPENIRLVVESAPQIYQFSSSFDSESSVSYTGQVFRTVLINDLKSFTSSLARGAWPGSAGGAINVLNSYFRFDSSAVSRGPGFVNGLSRHRVVVRNGAGELPILEGRIYNGIQSPGKNLVGKVAGEDNPLRHGRLLGLRPEMGAITPLDFIQEWFQQLAKNAAIGASFTVPNGDLPVQRIHAADTTPRGINITQIIQKFLHGSLAFSQAAGDYLSTDLGEEKGLNADDTAPYKGSRNYTALEHHWDEAFGYFGAAADFLLYSDKQVAKKLSRDTNGDGSISLLSEKNHGLAPRGAARIDLKIGGDLSSEIMEAFLAGRQLISKKPEGYRKYAKAYAAVVIGGWETTLAGITIHYINATLNAMYAYGTPSYSFMNHAKFWSEMKGFGLSFQFNPISLLEPALFKEFHRLVGDRPILMTASWNEIEDYQDRLYKARDILSEAFGFSEAQRKDLLGI